MSIKRTHYENAFEAYLSRRGTPCVAIEDVKHFAKARAGIKMFDYIVYPPGDRACLVDVKGRKSPSLAKNGEPRQKTWVTSGDIDGLTGWGDVFGQDYEATFVFAYWLADAADRPRELLDTGRYFEFAGRTYSFWIVTLREYLAHQKPLSKRWGTVSIPLDVFKRISRPLETAWPAAPC